MSEDIQEFEIAGRTIRLKPDEAALVIYADAALAGKNAHLWSGAPYATASFVNRDGITAAIFPKIKITNSSGQQTVTIKIIEYAITIDKAAPGKLLDFVTSRGPGSEENEWSVTLYSGDVAELDVTW